MARRLVNVDRETPLLMPPSIQEWIAEDDMARFIVEAVASVGEHHCSYNPRGSGSEQYPPHMMMALLIYCYANGLFSSRKIERATYRDIAVRFISGDTHPDHDTIAAFRRDNGTLFKACFLHVLELAREMKVQRIGAVAIDGTMLEASAAKHRTLSHAQMQEQLLALDAQIEQLIKQAENTDAKETPGNSSTAGDQLPAALVGARQRREAMRAALAELEERTRRRAAQREAERAAFDHQGPGKPANARQSQARPEDTLNLTDPDARLLAQKKGGYAPSYNVQVAVQAEHGAALIVAAAVSDQSNDRRQLEPMAQQVAAQAPQTQRILVDSGYDNSAQIYQIEQQHRIVIYCPPEEIKGALKTQRHSQSRQRTLDYREGMRACMRGSFGRQSRTLRSTTVEPVIGWIKKTLNFQRFSLRGMAKVRLEWDLVCLAFNLQLLKRIARRQATA